MHTFFDFLQTLDRRWIYLVLAITLVIALIKGKPINPVVLPQVQNFYDAVDQAPADPGQGNLVLIGMTFSGSTLGENGNQARALVRHLMLRHKHFAIMSVEPQGAMFARLLTEDIAAQYHYEYGKDWINFGYQLPTLAFYKSFPRDIQGVVKVDGTQHKPLNSFPVMQGVKTIKNIPLFAEVTASASVFDWLQYIQPTTSPRLKIGYACTGVMAAEAYPYLDSGQMVGMMPGMKGASDYEKLVDEVEAQQLKTGELKKAFNPDEMKSIPAFPQPARRLMYTQSVAHIVIIIFILLGNVGLLLSRSQRKRSTSKEEA